MACTYGGSNDVTVSKSTLLTNSAFSCKQIYKYFYESKVNAWNQLNQTTYRIIWWTILYFEYVHCTNHGLHCHKYILIDQFNETAFIFIGIATTVNDSHLFNKCGFPRFTSTYIEEPERERELARKKNKYWKWNIEIYMYASMECTSVSHPSAHDR